MDEKEIKIYNILLKSIFPNLIKEQTLRLLSVNDPSHDKILKKNEVFLFGYQKKLEKMINEESELIDELNEKAKTFSLPTTNPHVYQSNKINQRKKEMILHDTFTSKEINQIITIGDFNLVLAELQLLKAEISINIKREKMYMFQYLTTRKFAIWSIVLGISGIFLGILGLIF